MHKIVWEVLSPIHIGYRKYGNLMQTHPYITASALLGALNSILIRNENCNKDPRVMGVALNTVLRATYLYVLKEDGKVWFPWENEDEYLLRFIGSYVGTALNSGAKSAEEGSLRETEFISPRDRLTGKRVYFVGYLFTLKNNLNDTELETLVKEILSESPYDSEVPLNDVKECAEHLIDKLNSSDNCKPILSLLNQDLYVGGERNYGWGRIKCHIKEIQAVEKLFGRYEVDLSNIKGPIVILKKDDRLPAHTLSGDGIEGIARPLVRWATYGKKSPLEFNGIVYEPGSLVKKNDSFLIRALGILRTAKNYSAA